jgi:hypothetical protein
MHNSPLLIWHLQSDKTQNSVFQNITSWWFKDTTSSGRYSLTIGLYV